MSKHPVGSPLPGYLYTLAPTGRRERSILLKAACPCGKWHTHGAGTVERPAGYSPGTLVRRASHCPTYDYREIVVQPQAFRPTWATPRDRLSAAYRRAA